MVDFGFVAARALIQKYLQRVPLNSLQDPCMLLSYLVRAVLTLKIVMRIYYSFSFIHTKVTWRFHRAITMQLD